MLQLLNKGCHLLGASWSLPSNPGLDLWGQHTQELFQNQQLYHLIFGGRLRLQPLVTQVSKLGQCLSRSLNLLIAETPETESCSLRLLKGGPGVSEG